MVGLVAQKDEEAVPARTEDLYGFGTLALVREVDEIQGKDRAARVVLEGLERFRVIDVIRSEPYMAARFELRGDLEERGDRAEVLIGSVKTLFRQFVELAVELPDELSVAMQALPTARH